MNSYNVIGLMSGTSLDGLDIVFAKFNHLEGKWSFDIQASHCYPYSSEWKTKLQSAMSMDALSLHLLDIELGHYFASLINEFIELHRIKPDLISSHGHTIFHQPEKKLSLQIGAGQIICNDTKINTVCDFRKMDVARGGQGAPLVPVGDHLLFPDYDFCLNIGGIANISHQLNDKRIAYDICPANMVINHYAKQLDFEFDLNGDIARSGKVDEKLFEELNALSYYHKNFPKSIGREWVESKIFPLIDTYDFTIEDKLCAFTEHCAYQIAANCSSWGPQASSVLVTGGGAFNQYLIERINFHSKTELIVPDKQIIEFKEALIFAFLGVLFIRGENNCLKSVTGADKDHSGGVLFRY